MPPCIYITYRSLHCILIFHTTVQDCSRRAEFTTDNWIWLKWKNLNRMSYLQYHQYDIRFRVTQHFWKIFILIICTEIFAFNQVIYKLNNRITSASKNTYVRTDTRTLRANYTINVIIPPRQWGTPVVLYILCRIINFFKIIEKYWTSKSYNV